MRHGACPSVKLNHKKHVLSRMRPMPHWGLIFTPDALVLRREHRVVADFVVPSEICIRCRGNIRGLHQVAFKLYFYYFTFRFYILFHNMFLLYLSYLMLLFISLLLSYRLRCICLWAACRGSCLRRRRLRCKSSGCRCCRS